MKHNGRMHRAMLAMMAWLAIGMLPAVASAASELRVRDIQLETRQTGTETLTLELSEPATLRYFTLQNPPRLAIDLPLFRWLVPASRLKTYHGQLLSQLRYARNSETTSRIVLDLRTPVSVQLLTQNPTSTPRFRLIARDSSALASAATRAPSPAADMTPLVRSGTTNPARTPIEHTLNQHQVDAPVPAPLPQAKPNIQSSLKQPNPLQPTPAPQLSKSSISEATPTPRSKRRTIAIDAGHGGQDPGCIGQSGTREKNITLSYAKSLRDALNATGRYRAVLTRDNDIFIPLRQRVAIARKAKADLFISLHADSAPGAPVRGLSIYSLSVTGSDKEADKLAAAENKADIIDGVDLSGASPDVTDILIDLAQRTTMDKSALLARNVVRGVQRNDVATLPTPYRTAGFAVLKAADIPSVLVELGFLSHPQEEQLLQTNRHRQQIIQGLVKGIDSYFTTATTVR